MLSAYSYTRRVNIKLVGAMVEDNNTKHPNNIILLGRLVSSVFLAVATSMIVIRATFTIESRLPHENWPNVFVFCP